MNKIQDQVKLKKKESKGKDACEVNIIYIYRVFMKPKFLVRNIKI